MARYRPAPARPDIDEVFLSETYHVPLPGDELVLSSDAPAGGTDGPDGTNGLMERSSSEELLFHQPGLPLTYDTLKSLFHRLRRRANVPRLRPHLLRHTYACRYLLAHRDPLALKTMLGHTTLAMTNHYVAAVEGMQVIRSDRVSVVDAMGLSFARRSRRPAR